MTYQIEFKFPLTPKAGQNPKEPDYQLLEVEDAPYAPQVGEYVLVAGRRKVLEVVHYYGIPVENGDLTGLDGRNHKGRYMTLYVRLGRDQEPLC